MNLETIKKQLFSQFKGKPREEIESTMDSLKSELIYTEFLEELKEHFTHIPKLAALAEKVSIHFYNKYGNDGNEICQFYIRHQDNTVAFYWRIDPVNQHLAPRDYYNYHYFSVQDDTFPTDLEDKNTSLQVDSEYLDHINIDLWKKIAQKLDIEDVPAYDFVYFLASICSLSFKLKKDTSLFIHGYWRFWDNYDPEHLIKLGDLKPDE